MSHATTQIMGGRPTEMTRRVQVDKHAQKLTDVVWLAADKKGVQ